MWWQCLRSQPTGEADTEGQLGWEAGLVTEIMPTHSSLGDRQELCLKKKKKKEEERKKKKKKERKEERNQESGW